MTNNKPLIVFNIDVSNMSSEDFKIMRSKMPQNEYYESFINPSKETYIECVYEPENSHNIPIFVVYKDVSGLPANESQSVLNDLTEYAGKFDEREFIIVPNNEGKNHIEQIYG